MAYVPTATLFSTTPLDPGDTQGYGAGTKAFGFKEVITSARFNRISYALSLNIDDVNTRLINLAFLHELDVGQLEAKDDIHDSQISSLFLADVELSDRIDPFETTGLDAAYRLGLVDDPGGGRVIDADGGPVELRGSDTVEYGLDPINALLRIDTTAGTPTNSGTGLDIKSVRFGSGSTLFGIVERQVYTGNANTSIPANSLAVLNEDGVSFNQLKFSSSDTGYPDAEIFYGTDLIEISGGSDPGVYIISGVVDSSSLALLKLDGTTVPTFSQNESVTATLYRTRSSVGGRVHALLAAESFPNPEALIRARTVNNEAIEVHSGYGDGVKTFWVDKDGGVAGGSFSLTSPRTEYRTVIPSGFVLSGNSETAVVSQSSVVLNAGNSGGPLLGVEMVLDFGIPPGAMIKRIKLAAKRLVDAQAGIIDSVELSQVSTPFSGGTHGVATPGPTVTPILTNGTNVTLSTLDYINLNLDAIDILHEATTTYAIKVVFSGAADDSVFQLSFPTVMYEYSEVLL